MSNITFADLMNQFAVARGVNPSAAAGTSDLTDETKIYATVEILNAATRWVWKERFPRFALPETVSSATVTVTSGLIAAADLGEFSGCSLWTADPRPVGSTGVEISGFDVKVDASGVYPQTQSTSLFAFYRTACPQGTWVAGGTYAAPANIPAALREPIMLKATELWHESESNWQAMAMRRKDAEEWMDARRVALVNSGLVWNQNWIAT